MTFIYDAIRVPTGKKSGWYKNILPEELAAFLIDELIQRNNLGEHDLELILGNAIGTMGNMARNAALRSNLKVDILASTVDLQCGGAYQALKNAMSLSIATPNTLLITGGMESNSLMPQRSYHKNDPRNTGAIHIDKAEFSPHSSVSLEHSAEKLANDYGISKTEMMTWTVESHKRASVYQKTDSYNRHIVSFKGLSGKDQMTKKNLTLKHLQKLETEALIDRTTSADFHDGAGLLLIGGQKIIHKRPIAKVVDIQILGIEPDDSPRGCILATEKLLSKNGLRVSDIDVYEVNESFASKPLAFARHFGIDDALINLMGGNLAMGHPYSASGVLNMINLLAALKLKKKKIGLVSAGIAGGYGAAVLIENLV
ncbi:MAG: acetyl-CoA C-acetyltransferase [Algoriphagus sp.]|jgi:acetyl-CoA C-acetyltransferase